MGNLVTPKIIKYEIKPEVLRAIQFHARVNMDNMHTEGISEEQQSTGYHAFKQLCLMKGEIPKQEDISNGDRGVVGTILNVKPGSYLLTRLHPLVRRRAIECAEEIRKLYKIS